jgi:MoaA/NifB/PqqE/SkfB family radical SAM enzyme
LAHNELIIDQIDYNRERFTMLSSEFTSALPFLAKHSHVLLKGLYRRTCLGLPYAFSFNISDRCPVGCHCYWRAQARVTELSDDDVVSFFRRKRREGYVQANIIGGEPYVRPQLLANVAGIIPFNWVVTSGTTPLRRLRNTTHVISIDGATGEIHDSVRRMKGLYARILKHLAIARSGGDFPTIIHTTLNAQNYTGLETILATWSSNGLADGIMISTLTPIRDAGDESYRLSREQRIWIVDELLRLKNQYADFLCMTEAMIRRLHPDHTEQLEPARCDTARWIESYDAAGKRVPQCVLSDKADCNECGCIITTMSDGSKGSSIGTMLETAGTMMKTLTLR